MVKLLHWSIVLVFCFSILYVPSFGEHEWGVLSLEDIQALVGKTVYPRHNLYVVHKNITWLGGLSFKEPAASVDENGIHYVGKDGEFYSINKLTGILSYVAIAFLVNDKLTIRHAIRGGRTGKRITVFVKGESAYSRKYEKMRVFFDEVQDAEHFKRLFEMIFSEIPLEEEYEWPPEIKKNVAARQPKIGMTEEMLYVALGDPIAKGINILPEGIEQQIRMYTLPLTINFQKKGLWTTSVSKENHTYEITLTQGRVSGIKELAF